MTMSPISNFLLFVRLMDSLDRAFLALQGIGTWESEGWGERFFTELNQKHTQWAEKRISIYKTSSELLYYFAFREGLEELGNIMYHKPEVLLRMVLQYFQHTLD
jgi:hypothetical protein